ncbi:hypothetical protein D3C76_1841840 [compost metagenome]|jgi:tRNA threonylcarbamoyladenosine modification (KEOPS) complex  Pcc1 subunit
MEIGKSYKVIMAFTYDVYEAKVVCEKVLPKSYRIKHQDGRMELIKKDNIVELKELTPDNL